MKLRLLSGLIILFIVLSACQLFNPAPGENAGTLGNPAGRSGQTGETSSLSLVPVANPPAVQVSLDESGAVEALIPLEGGRLETAGVDGTRYLLEIPADALVEATTIRMIPAALSEMPFGGERTYAAQLEPEGLQLMNFATLTITPAEEIPLEEQNFFGYEGAGKDVIFATPVVDSAEIKLRLLHFSGYGVNKGLLADPERERERLGGSAERRLQNAAGQLLAQERQRQLLGSGDQDSEAIQQLLQLFEQYRKEVVDVRIAAAGQSCAAGRLALQTALGFERQLQLLGAGENSKVIDLLGLMDTVGKVCVKEEYELCKEQHIIHRMIPVWLGIERQMQLLGATENSGTSELVQYARDLTEKCLTFDLEFESQAKFDDGGGGGYDSAVKAKVPVKFSTTDIRMGGSSALVNESFTFRTPGCRTESIRGGSTFGISSLAYQTGPAFSDELGYVEDFKLLYFPERTTEVFKVACPDEPIYTSPPSGLWSAIYLVLHQAEIHMGTPVEGEAPAAPPVAQAPDIDEIMKAAESGVNLPMFAPPMVGPGAGFLVEGWEILNGALFARKEWTMADGGLGLSEEGRFLLYHRPR